MISAINSHVRFVTGLFPRSVPSVGDLISVGADSSRPGEDVSVFVRSKVLDEVRSQLRGGTLSEWKFHRRMLAVLFVDRKAHSAPAVLIPSVTYAPDRTETDR